MAFAFTTATGFPPITDAFFIVVIGVSCDFVSTATLSRSVLAIVGEEVTSDATGTEVSTTEIVGVVIVLTAMSILVLTECSVEIECSFITFSSTLRCSFL